MDTDTARLPGSIKAATPSAPPAVAMRPEFNGSFAEIGNSSGRSSTAFSSMIAPRAISLSPTLIVLTSPFFNRVPAGKSRAAARMATVFSTLGAAVAR